jgi:hypothetical protein
MPDRTEEEYRIMLTELNKVVTDKTVAATSDRLSLRDAVCDYVSAEQARGTSLHNIIQIVKQILRNAEEKTNGASDASELRNNELARQLVDWCEAFHRLRFTPA